MAPKEAIVGAWHPTTENEKKLVRAQLARIVSDVRFSASSRYPQLLRYIVEETLAGNEDNLKERTIGVEVFHRSPDYDSNLDPVVRICATQVRKRLDEYYDSPVHKGELRFVVNPGSYVPVFSLPALDGPALEMISTDVPNEAEQVLQPLRRQAKRTRIIGWSAGLIVSGVTIVAVLVLVTRYWPQYEKRTSALDEVWAPLLSSSKPVLFCMGVSKMITIPGSQLAALQSGADEDSSFQGLADGNDFVPFSDVQILSRFSSFVETHGHAFRVQSFRATVSSQLREGPVVLIGALNNDWTLNRTSSLRFHFEGLESPTSLDRTEERQRFTCGGPGQQACAPSTAYWIEDRQHPESREWQVKIQPRGRDALRDYAIAARFTDEGTGQVVLVAAGIAGSGTRAAGEFLTDAAALKQLADSAGADWGKKNFEVVLSSQVVNGIQGKPRIEAKVFW